MATTIADQLYVTVQYRGDTNNDDGLLGFASPYTKDKPFEKRKDTQDKWAYGYGVTVTINENDDIAVTGEGTRGGYGRGEKWDATMLFIANCHPRIVDNKPQAGFQIAKSVRRYGWNGGGNVKWRITDPRGFDLEISSENFASVLGCCTMVNGVIQEECVWGREGANNILLPVTSEPYQSAKKMTAKVNSKVSLKDVQVGDIVEIVSSRVSEEDQKCQYLGKYFFLQSESVYSGQGRYYGQTIGCKTAATQKEKYLFKSVASGEYFVVSSPKVSFIVEKIATPLDKVTIAQEVTTALIDANYTLDDLGSLVLISPTKITDTATSLAKSTFTYSFGAPWPKVNKYYNRTYFAKLNGKEFVTRVERNSYNEPEKPMELLAAAVTNGLVTIDHETQVVRSNSYWSRDQIETKYFVTSAYDPTVVEFYDIVVEANGIRGVVKNIGI